MTTPAENVSTTEPVVTPARNGLGEAADEAVQRAAGGEGEAVAVEDPDDHHEAGDGEDLHQDREHVLGADEAAVEERQAGDGHQQHECGRDQHPRRVARDRATGAAAAQSLPRPRRRPRRRSRGVLGEGRRDSAASKPITTRILAAKQRIAFSIVVTRREGEPASRRSAATAIQRPCQPPARRRQGLSNPSAQDFIRLRMRDTLMPNS